MSPYVALLRAINVAGHQPVKMPELRASFEALGFEGVTTYLQSGNVLFRCPSRPADAIAKVIEQRLAKDFGAPIRVVVKSDADMHLILSANPFAKTEQDPTKLLVTFCMGIVTKQGLAKLDLIPKGKDRFHPMGNVLYLHCPEGYGHSKLANPNVERVLGVEATTRNWRTVGEVCGLFDQAAGKQAAGK